jgi:hypothetical protein
MSLYYAYKLFILKERDPLATFMYGLRAPDTRRQYPRRFQYFLDFLRISGTLEEQAKQFVLKQEKIDSRLKKALYIIEFQKERVGRAEKAESTITNYYKATKIFCVINDVVLNHLQNLRVAQHSFPVCL